MCAEIRMFCSSSSMVASMVDTCLGQDCIAQCGKALFGRGFLSCHPVPCGGFGLGALGLGSSGSCWYSCCSLRPSGCHGIERGSLFL